MNFYPRPPRGGRPVTTFLHIAYKDFYPRPPRGGRLQGLSVHFDCARFLSTPSARRATAACTLGQPVHIISIHALREEGDSGWWTSSSRCDNFYPRPPRGGRPAHHHSLGLAESFLSTPSARRATDNFPPPPAALAISIHALREEGDGTRAERRLHAGSFLSTPSARRATNLTGEFIAA